MHPAWLILLLPMACGAGWFAASAWRRLRAADSRADLPAAYFRGLNFLLNEQPDKAIEVFLEMMEVDSQTVETHIAIGNLFRRRGEVDRATRIHQSLIARPNLQRNQRALAMEELGQDYFKAGLLDRAEGLFLELAEDPRQTGDAYRHLLLIYEQEREWDKCISVARRVAHVSDGVLPPATSQYYCELAESHIAEGRYTSARRACAEALTVDPDCVRATIQLGRLQATAGEHREAIDTWLRVEDQDPRYFGEVVDLLRGSYEIVGELPALEQVLARSIEKNRDSKLVLAMVDVVEQSRGTGAAEAFLVEWLRRYPSIYGLHRLIRLRVEAADEPLRRDLALLDGMIGGIIERDPAYGCQRCGFAGRRLHWHCPGCKGWNTFLPITSRQVIETEVLDAQVAAG